jgi:hypothetical protein
MKSGQLISALSAEIPVQSSPPPLLDITSILCIIREGKGAAAVSQQRISLDIIGC